MIFKIIFWGNDRFNVVQTYDGIFETGKKIKKYMTSINDS